MVGRSIGASAEATEPRRGQKSRWMAATSCDTRYACHRGARLGAPAYSHTQKSLSRGSDSPICLPGHSPPHGGSTGPRVRRYGAEEGRLHPESTWNAVPQKARWGSFWWPQARRATRTNGDFLFVHFAPIPLRPSFCDLKNLTGIPAKEANSGVSTNLGIE
jgi:hypothetical protein